MANEKKPQERHARLKAAIWLDEHFISLPVVAQWLYVVIISQPGITLCGVIQPSFKRWATFAPDVTADDLERAAKDLEAQSFIDIDDDTDELLVRSFVRHGLALDTPNSIVGMSKAFETIHSKALREVVIKELRKALDKPLIKGLSRDIPDGLNEPLRRRLSNAFVLAWDGAT
jgi:hypothetical protein